MKRPRKIQIIFALSVLAICSVFFMPAIGQNPLYHEFADRRKVLGIPNGLNVISNLPFLCVGLIGLNALLIKRSPIGIKFVYAVLFSGIIFTGIGSAYYHLCPDNARLVWDRIPMTVVFMSLLSATIAELINQRIGVLLTVPFLLVGIFSVLYWYWGEAEGRGDLRIYALIQYYPIIILPIMMGLFYSLEHRPVIRLLQWAVFWYILAKGFEYFDRRIYSCVTISGHTLKHLAAAISTWYLVKTYFEKYPDVEQRASKSLGRSEV